jgi:hypothetical protein
LEYLKRIGLQPNSLSSEGVPANAISEILQNEVVYALGRGPLWLNWVKIPVDAVPLEVIDEDVPILRRFVRSLADSQKRFDNVKANEIMKTLSTGFMHRVVGLFLADGMKGVFSGTSAESELIPILLDPKALIDSELTEFLEERRGEINSPASEIVKQLRKFEKAADSLKEKKDQDIEDYASHVKDNGVTRETGEIRGNQLWFEGLDDQYAAMSNRIRISADACETRSAGNTDLVSCYNFWRYPVLKESQVPSGEKVSHFRTEPQQEREKLLYWGVFAATPIPADTVGEKWYFLGRALFGSRPVDAAMVVFSTSKEGKDPR